MKVDFLGDRSKPKILLIHPSVADSRCFAPLFPYLREFCLVLPTLGGHNVCDDSVYMGGKAEAEALLSELEANGITSLHAMCAQSLGCIVGWEILLSRRLKIGKTVFDGAPFGRFNVVTRFLNYLLTLHLVRQCRKNPEKMKFLDETYPQVSDCMKEVLAHYTKNTVKNVVRDAMTGVRPLSGAIVAEDHLTVIYGGKDPYIRGRKFFEEAGPATFLILESLGHCAYLLQEPEKYCSLIAG